MIEKVVSLQLSSELASFLDLLIHRLGTGGTRQTFTFLASMIVHNKLTSLEYLNDTFYREIFLKEAKRKGDERVAVSFKGNKQATAIFYKAKAKLEKLLGQNLSDVMTLRLLLLLAFYDRDIGLKNLKGKG